MKKRYCDLCGKETTNNTTYELGIYDETLEKDIFEVDMCGNCKEKIKKLIKGVKEKII